MRVHTGIHTYIGKYGWTCVQTVRQTDGQKTERQRDGQLDRQTDMQSAHVRTSLFMPVDTHTENTRVCVSVYLCGWLHS